MKFFTSDTHFGHKAMLYFGRVVDFASIEEHDEALIQQWNSVVKPKDEVYHLGDWSMNGLTFMAPIFKRLNGNIITMRGNHDRNCWVDCDVLEINTPLGKIFMSHYPHLEWANMQDGVVHLFGHVHGKVRGVIGSLDVGVDNARTVLGQYRPFSLEEVFKYSKKENLP